MTVAAETPHKELAWTGVETSFAAGFTAEAVSHVTVKFKDEDGVVTSLTDGVHVEISIDGDNLVTVEPLSMPDEDGTVIIDRVTPDTVEEDFAQLGEYSPSALQTAADAAARRSAEHRYQTARRLPLDAGGDAYTAGSKKISDVADGVAGGDAVNVTQLAAALAAVGVGATGPAGDNLFTALTEAIKTGDYTVLAGDRGKALIANKATALTFTLPSVTTLATYVYFFGNINDGALTIDGDGAENIWSPEAGEATTVILDKGDSAMLVGNGSIWRAFVTRAEGRAAPETSIASAATVDLGGAKTGRVRVTGNTGPVTSFGTGARKRRLVYFESNPTLTHSATLVLLSGADRVVTAGAIGEYVSDASATPVWLEVAYRLPNGKGEVSDLAFVSEPTTRLFRNAAGDLRWNILGAEILQLFGDGTQANNELTVNAFTTILGEMAMGGSISQNAVETPVALAGDEDDYALPDDCAIVRLTCAADRIITGFEAPANARRVWIWNANAAAGATITIPELDSGSVAENQVQTGDGDIVLHPGKGAEFIYDTTEELWRVAREVDLATAIEIWTGTAGKIITAEMLAESEEIVALAFGATVTPNLAAGKNFEIGITNAITSNFALAAPTNPKSGQEFFVRIKQGATPRVITFNAAYHFAGGVDPTLTAIAARFDHLYCKVVDPTTPVIAAYMIKDVK